MSTKPVTLMGIGDEAGPEIDHQLAAIRELGWTCLEARTIEVPGFPKSNIHDLEDAAFDLARRKLEAAGVRVY
ncbi:MAG TPA: sugar phosphate isomerase/epimerase, partial [Candidatus Paceibacterota bacterium]|nr:sugar phosphate isomerase/epimerase [Candidatus Paceibacterota bacterium]